MILIGINYSVCLFGEYMFILRFKIKFGEYMESI